MPYSKEHKSHSRERIMKSALTLFSRQGYEKTSIDKIMHDAQLTRGAFYAHFKSKQDLYAQAIASTAVFSIFNQKKPDALKPYDWFSRLITAYLSPQHLDKASPPCPLAFLVTDVAVNAPEAREAYTEVYRSMNALMLKLARRANDISVDENTIMALTSMMIGGVAIARTLTDRKTQLKVLRSCQQAAMRWF